MRRGPLDSQSPDPTCPWCGEPVLWHERGRSILAIGAGGQAEDRAWHRECSLRSVIGSVGHQRRECSCYGGTGDGDPPGMTRREAARAAALLALMTWPLACED